MSIALSSVHGKALTALANGTFATFWNGDGNAPMAQFFNADGTKKGSPVALAEGSNEENLNFSAASLSDGRFAVAWEHKGSKSSIHARIFEVEGKPVGDAFTIGSGGAAQILPQVTALKGGGFTVASINAGVATSVAVNANGVQASPVALKSGAVDVSIATLTNGRLVSIIGTGSVGNFAVHGDIQEPDGTAYVSGGLIPSFSDSDRPNARVAGLSDGGFIFTFDGIQSGYDSIDLYRYSSSGTPIGTGLTFKSGAGETVSDPVVEGLPNGGFVFAYTAASSTGKDIYVGSTNLNSLFGLMTQKTGEDFSNIGDQSSPEIAVLNDGRYIVSWLNVSNGVTETRAEILDPRMAGVSWIGADMNEQYVGTFYNDNLNGASGDDLLIGGEGNDIIDGGAGADRMIGGVGHDVYYVDNTGDQVTEISTGDSNQVYTSISFALPNYVRRLVGTGSDALKLTGNSLDNTIAGNSGRNTVKGGTGNDTLNGGAGDDSLFGGVGKDVLTGGKGKDVFVFDTKPNKKTNLDKIADFNVKDDTIWLDNKYMPKLGKGYPTKPVKLNKKFFTLGDKAKDKNDYLVYNAKKGVLYYDVDGSGSKAAVEVAVLKKGLKMTYNDFFIV